MITLQRFLIVGAGEQLVHEWQRDFSPLPAGPLLARMGVSGNAPGGTVRVRARVGGTIDGIDGTIIAEKTLAGAESFDVVNQVFTNPNALVPFKYTAELLSGAQAEVGRISTVIE